jgi:hypothetical protein
LLSVLVMATACARVAERPPAVVEPPAEGLAAVYAGLADSAELYRVDDTRSEVRMLVWRAGRLARLGHNHVVVGHALDGYVAVAREWAESRADVVLSLEGLVVDDPGHRSQAGAGFEGAISARARDGTRDNMLGDRVLDAARYRAVTIAVHGVRGRPPDVVLESDITIRDVTRRADIAARLGSANGALVVDAEFPVRQSDFVIEPYSALGGALAVRDQVDLQVHIVAVPWLPAQ